MERRAAQQREADRAAKRVTQFAGLGVLVAFVIALVFLMEGPGGFQRFADLVSAPVLGPVVLWQVLLALAVTMTLLPLILRLKR